MDPYKLSEDQIRFELAVRGLSAEGEINVLASRLHMGILLSQEMVPIDVNVEEETKYCKSLLEVLSKEVAGFKGKSRSPKIRGIESKVLHVINRARNVKLKFPDCSEATEDIIRDARDIITKIAAIVSSPESETEVSESETEKDPKDRKKKSPSKKIPGKPVEEVAGSGDVTLTAPVPCQFGMVWNPVTGSYLLYPGVQALNTQVESSGSSVTPGLSVPPPPRSPNPGTPKPSDPNPTTPAPNPFTPQPFPLPVSQFRLSDHHAKSEPVYKWQVKKFDGKNPDYVWDFLAEVEEKAKTRSVSMGRLFIESAELFEGEALLWYRDAVQRVNSWEGLKQELKIAYHGVGNDSSMRERIRGCKQAKRETIDVFLAKIEGMYARLERKVSEPERVEEILRNLNGYLKEKLTMITINSIHELRTAARMAEAGRQRMGIVELQSATEKSSFPSRAVHAMHADKESPEKKDTWRDQPFACFNCKKPDHAFRQCSLPLRKFCRRCGYDEATVYTCPNCKPKQKNE